MKSQDIWEVLEINGDSEKVQMLFAHIKEHTMGAAEDHGIMKIFIKDGCKGKIIKLVDKSNFGLDLKWSFIRNKDWHLMWKENFTSVNIDNIIHILPDWKYDKSLEKNSVFIRPGMSFGTGHHETTHLMIRALIKYRDQKLSLLDLGSGSGILSIVSQKLGYTKIMAVENDLVCEEDIKYNCQINNCNQIEVYFDDALNWSDFNYDIVAANIEKNIIKNIIKNVDKTNARFVFSGLLKENKEEMLNYLVENNFMVEEIQSYNEWISINCRKNER